MKTGSLCLETWFGRVYYKVTIIGETPKRYRIVPVDKKVRLPKHRSIDIGQSTLVPKYAVLDIKDE